MTEEELITASWERTKWIRSLVRLGGVYRLDARGKRKRCRIKWAGGTRDIEWFDALVIMFWTVTSGGGRLFDELATETAIKTALGGVEDVQTFWNICTWIIEHGGLVGHHRSLMEELRESQIVQYGFW